MEDADILTKKRDNSHGCSSYFLSSESLGDHHFGLCTPNFGEALTSSYFNSPSSSEEVVHPGTRLDSLQDLTELTLDLDDSDRELSKQKCSQRSPFHPEDRITGLRCGEQHLDILSDLLALGCTSICEKICSYMKAQDLYRFAPSIRFTMLSFAVYRYGYAALRFIATHFRVIVIETKKKRNHPRLK